MGEAKRRAVYLDNARRNAKTLEEFQAIERKRYKPVAPQVIVVDTAEKAIELYARREHKPDKGLKNGSCNREACQEPGATWRNTNGKYYCTHCAGLINDAAMGRTLIEQTRNKPMCVDEAEDPEGTEKFVCIRVCSIGEAKFTVRDKEGMEGWVEYNLETRMGQALFVNGEYAGGGKGYLDDTQIERVGSYLKDQLEIDMKRPIERLRMQPEYFGGIDLGTRLRYNDERLYQDLRSTIRN